MTTHYKLEGTPNSPVLVFSNSLGTDLTMWNEIVPLLLPYFQVLRYDTRGHGQSEITPEPYTIAQLGQDVIDLLDQLGVPKAAFCGLSMGGLIGQWLGVNYPERFSRLILCNTAAKVGTADAWNERIDMVKQKGMSPITDQTLKIWFSEAFRENAPQRTREMKTVFLNNDPQGYSNCCAAIRDADFRTNLKDIALETLVIAGADDPATTVEDAKYMVEQLPNAKPEILPARHLSNIEQPDAFAAALINFLVGPTVFDQGMHVRRTVLGDAHVDRANANVNDFNADFQSFISQYAWGEVWTRPGLSKHQRSLITVAMLIALNRPAELKMHLRAAINNGVTIGEIKEVILQSGLYCGLPAANAAFHLAEAIFQESELIP